MWALDCHNPSRLAAPLWPRFCVHKRLCMLPGHSSADCGQPAHSVGKDSASRPQTGNIAAVPQLSDQLTFFPAWLHGLTLRHFPSQTHARAGEVKRCWRLAVMSTGFPWRYMPTTARQAVCKQYPVADQNREHLVFLSYPILQRYRT